MDTPQYVYISKENPYCDMSYKRQFPCCLGCVIEFSEMLQGSKKPWSGMIMKQINIDARSISCWLGPSCHRARRRDTTSTVIVVLRLSQSKNVCLRKTRNWHRGFPPHLLLFKHPIRHLEDVLPESDSSPDHPSLDLTQRKGNIAVGVVLLEAFRSVKEVVSWERPSLRFFVCFFYFWSWTLRLP